ncbi:hypothetical protein ACQ4PT_034842 [Festuca glaucescens]
MAAGVDQQPLPFFLRPVLLHAVGAGAHLLLALAIAGRLLFAAAAVSRRGKESAASGRGGHGARLRWCRLVLRATWALVTSEVFFSAYSLVSWYLDGGTGWGAPDAVANYATRAVAWLLLAAYLQLEYGGPRQEERFPAPLRLWWALFLLLSVLAVAIHAATSLQHRLPVPALSWARDAVSLLVGVVLLVVGFSAKSEAVGGSASEEPLLNGASNTAAENNTVDASIFTGAGFFSFLTFSWMAPLLAVGHRKTLDLEDVPDLDIGDSVAGLLPLFKANLEALTGDGSGGQKVTAFNLAKALVRTVRWHIALTALYALIYTISIYVGPYLINTLVQYLNGDKRYAGKGKLVVVIFIVAKVFECLSQRHWFFRVQQTAIRARFALKF